MDGTYSGMIGVTDQTDQVSDDAAGSELVSSRTRGSIQPPTWTGWDEWEETGWMELTAMRLKGRAKHQVADDVASSDHVSSRTRRSSQLPTWLVVGWTEMGLTEMRRQDTMSTGAKLYTASARGPQESSQGRSTYEKRNR